VRAAAANALTKFKTGEAMNALLEGTKDKDSRVRSIAINGIRDVNAGEVTESPTLKLVFLILFGVSKHTPAES
jgi:HEAT repeat protein